MIDIKDMKNCCGCASCVQKCPKWCISLHEDEEGFLYPKVDTENCVNCGLCEKVCPVLNQEEKHKPLTVYAAKNKDEEKRKNSSSGGVFTLLAENVIRKGGVVFGARFNERWEIVHDFVESIDDLKVFRGSKYVQSKIGNTYYKASTFLNNTSFNFMLHQQRIPMQCEGVNAPNYENTKLEYWRNQSYNYLSKTL